MTKADLIEAVARATESIRKDSEVIVEETFENIIKALNRGENLDEVLTERSAGIEMQNRKSSSESKVTTAEHAAPVESGV